MSNQVRKKYFENLIGKTCFVIRRGSKRRAFVTPKKVRKLEGKTTLFFEYQQYKGTHSFVSEVSDIKAVHNDI